MKLYIYTGIIFLILTSLSCSKNFKSIKIVENKSAYNLKVILYNGILSSGEWKVSDSLYVSPKSQVTIVELNSSVGSFYVEGQCARSDMDSIVAQVMDNPTLKVIKDFSDDANWVSKKDAGFRETETECKATITDADIVPK